MTVNTKSFSLNCIYFINYIDTCTSLKFSCLQITLIYFHPSTQLLINDILNGKVTENILKNVKSTNNKELNLQYIAKCTDKIFLKCCHTFQQNIYSSVVVIPALFLWLKYCSPLSELFFNPLVRRGNCFNDDTEFPTGCCSSRS